MLWGILIKLAVILLFLIVTGHDAYAFASLRSTVAVPAPLIIQVAKKQHPGVKKMNRAKMANKVLHKKRAPQRAKKSEVVVSNYDFAPLSPELCLARNMVGEGELEPEDSLRGITYVAIRHAREKRRSICAEVYSCRYSWACIKRNRRYVHGFKLKALRPYLAIARDMLAHPVPPYKEIEKADGYVHVNKDLSTERGWGWMQRNTHSLCVTIGSHEYRIAKPKAEYVTVRAGKDKKGRGIKVTIALPMPRTPPVPPCATVVVLKAQSHIQKRSL